MNPGRLTPHHGCAVRWSGGIPPMLMVPQQTRRPLYLLLVPHEGRSVNQRVLDKVAEPMEIIGEAVWQGELYLVRADPTTCRIG